MLKEVLKEIKDGKYISKSNIANKLNITDIMVEEAFSQLIRMGYIKENKEKSCDYKCSGCSFSNLCNKSPVTTVQITKKGDKILNK